MLIQEIKNRINSIQSIRKITHAMELVATSKLQKVRRNFTMSNDYLALVTTTFSKVFQSIPDLKTVLNFDSSKPNLYVIITGDYGFCGAYNNNIFKLARQNVKVNDQIVVFGTKGQNYFKSLNRQVIRQINDLGDIINYHEIHDLVNLVSNKLLTGEIQNITVISTKYFNSITFLPQITPIFDFQSINSNSNYSTFDFEPSPGEVLIKTLPLYIGAIIYGKLIESKISETAMRRIAMENATDNADDLISDLSVKYNQARQAAITKKLLKLLVVVKIIKE